MSFSAIFQLLFSLSWLSVQVVYTYSFPFSPTGALRIEYALEQNIPLHPHPSTLPPLHFVAFNCTVHICPMFRSFFCCCIDVCILPPLQMLPSLPTPSYAQLCVRVCVCACFFFVSRLALAGILQCSLRRCGARSHIRMKYCGHGSAYVLSMAISLPLLGLRARTARSGSTTGHIAPKCLFFTFHTI